MRHVSPAKRQERTTILRRADAWCVVVLAAVTLTVFWQGWYDPVSMVHEDASYLLQPYYQFAADEIRGGRFPHWNPFASCGMPFHATLQGAVLYPFRWPLFWLRWPVGYAMSVCFHYFLTGLFTFVFIRATLKCGALPALTGATSFTFGGFTLGHLTHPNYFQAYPWFVLTLLLLSRAVERRRWVWSVAGGVPVGLMGLAGSVHVLLILAFGLALWSLGELMVGIVRSFSSGRSAMKNAFYPAFAVVAAFGIGGLLAAAQILPAHLQMQLSSRASLDYDSITEISAHPLRTIVRLVVPFYWGNYRLWYWGDNLFHEQCFYTGLVPLLAAMVAIALVPRNRWVMRLVILCVITGVVAAGKYLPVFWCLYRFVPMFDRLRDPARLLWWVQFGIACLAAIGLDTLNRSTALNERRRAVVAVAMGTFAVAIIMMSCLAQLAALARDPQPAIEFVRGLGNLSDDQRMAYIEGARRMPKAVIQEGDIVTWLGVFAATFSCVVFAGSVVLRGKLSGTVGSSLILLLVIDLGMMSAGMLHYTREDKVITSTPPHARFLQQHLGTARYLCLLSPLDEVSLHRGMFFRICHAVAGGGGIFHTPRQERMIELLLKGNMRLANLAGVRYVVSERPMKSSTLRPVYQTDQCVINENIEALPRAFLVRDFRAFSDPNGVTTEILDGSGSLRDVVLLEHQAEPLPSAMSDVNQRDAVTDLLTEPGRFRMRTQSKGERYLVLTETYHPEWRCFIDGQSVRVHPADWVFMAVRVPGGEHRIEWRYVPVRFAIGLAVSVVSWVSLVLFLAGSLFIERRARRGGSLAAPPVKSPSARPSAFNPRNVHP